MAWNFGNMKPKRRQQQGQQDGTDMDAQQQYNGGEE